MALARARQFQHEQTLKENETKRIEKLFQLKIVQPGDAVNYPKHGDSICIHYAGYLEDGTCFDNSWQRGQSINFLLGSKQVIEAIELVVPLLSRGEKARLVIPSEVSEFRIFLSFFLFSVFINASSDLSLLQLNFLSIVWLRRERISTNHPSKFNTYL